MHLWAFTPKGTSANFEPSHTWLSKGLVGYWKLDEADSVAADEYQETFDKVAAMLRLLQQNTAVQVAGPF